jgi:hypothetical protein
MKALRLSVGAAINAAGLLAMPVQSCTLSGT